MIRNDEFSFEREFSRWEYRRTIELYKQNIGTITYLYLDWHHAGGGGGSLEMQLCITPTLLKGWIKSSREPG